MRIWIDRTALAARGLTVLDVESAIKKQNVELPGGLIASTKRELTVKTDSRLATPGRVRAGRRLEPERLPRPPRRGREGRGRAGGRPLRVLQGRQHRARPRHRAPGDRQHARGRRRGPGRARRSSRARCRPAPKLSVMYDESNFIRASINGVLKTLVEGIGLVILVILVFLRDWRSTIVAMVAIPVSVIASFMVVAFFGASINVLTLLAIVLAIGIVVDDAIVEIENIHRRIEHGEPPLLASFDGAREIGFAVIATTCDADGGVRAARLHDRQHRPALPRVRDPARGRDLLLRRRRPHADADDVLEADGAGARPDPPPDRADLRRHDQRLSLAPVAGAQHPARDPGDRRRGLVCRRQPLPGAPEGVRADRGPRLRPDPDPGAGGVERRLHPRAAEGGRAGDRAAARARR